MRTPEISAKSLRPMQINWAKLQKSLRSLWIKTEDCLKNVRGKHVDKNYQAGT
jgi:hypothetical protein